MGEKCLSTPRPWMALFLSLLLNGPPLPVGTADSWALPDGCRSVPGTLLRGAISRDRRLLLLWTATWIHALSKAWHLEPLGPLNHREQGLRRELVFL